MLLSVLTALALSTRPAALPARSAPARVQTVNRPSVRLLRAQAANRSTGTLRSYGRSHTLAQLYRNRSIGFAMRYPKDWSAQDLLGDSGNVTAVMAFVSPAEGPDDANRENINLVTEDISASDVSFEEYSDHAIELERQSFSSYTLSANVRTLWKGLPARHIRYQTDFRGSMLSFEQLWFQREGIVYVWTLAAPPPAMDRYSEMFRKMIDSMIFEE